MVASILLLICGLIILWKCADLLVTGAAGLAERLGISSLVIGLTVVAMGTSAPEVAASIAAALENAGDIAIGNVYGSNIANLALVGGVCAVIRPIMIRPEILKKQMPVMLVVALLLWPVLGNLHLSRLEGFLLLSVFAALIYLTVYFAKKQAQSQKLNNATAPQDKDSAGSMKKSLLFVVIGLAGLAIGAKMTVNGAVFIGQSVGLSEAVIGLTIIAVGTSLPELATCVAASVKGEHDISIGNLVGSNIFNTLLVVGTAGTIRPFAIVQRLAGIDYWVMIVVSVGFAVMAFFFKGIQRSAGILLLCGYVGYIVYLLV